VTGVDLAGSAPTILTATGSVPLAQVVQLSD